MKKKIYKEYPYKITVMRAILLFLTITLGILTTWFNKILLISYVSYIILMLYFVFKYVCRYCYYFGKNCDKGFGKIVSIFFKNRIIDNRKFQFYGNICTVLIIILLSTPIVVGIIKMLLKNSHYNLILLILTFLIGTFYILSQQIISCPHCAMKNLCGVYIKNK